MFGKKEKAVTEQRDVEQKKIFGKVQKIIMERLDVDPEEITEDTLLGEDLQAGIFDILGIAMDLVEEFEIEMDLEEELDIEIELFKWVTVKDMMDTLRQYGIE